MKREIKKEKVLARSQKREERVRQRDAKRVIPWFDSILVKEAAGLMALFSMVQEGTFKPEMHLPFVSDCQEPKTVQDYRYELEKRSNEAMKFLIMILPWFKQSDTPENKVNCLCIII